MKLVQECFLQSKDLWLVLGLFKTKDLISSENFLTLGGGAVGKGLTFIIVIFGHYNSHFTIKSVLKGTSALETN